MIGKQDNSTSHGHQTTCTTIITVYSGFKVFHVLISIFFRRWQKGRQNNLIYRSFSHKSNWFIDITIPHDASIFCDCIIIWLELMKLKWFIGEILDKFSSCYKHFHCIPYQAGQDAKLKDVGIFQMILTEHALFQLLRIHFRSRILPCCVNQWRV